LADVLEGTDQLLRVLDTTGLICLALLPGKFALVGGC
jgi:hypothetical protein